MNDGEIEDLRRAFTTPGGTAPRPEDCPPPETIWAAVHGELPPGPLREIVDHTAVCPACAEDWRLAVEAEREAAAAAGGTVQVAPPLLYSRRWVRLAPLAAAAAAIVLLVVGQPFVQHPGEPTFRGPKKVVSLLEEGKVLPRGNCLLVWKGPPGASYDVEVRTLIGTSLDTAHGLTATQYRVPEAKLAGVPAGNQLEWQVTATLPDRAPLRSEKFRFTLP